MIFRVSGGLLSYSAPEPSAEKGDHVDKKYDGWKDSSGNIVGGLGVLTDGQVGGDFFSLDMGFAKGKPHAHPQFIRNKLRQNRSHAHTFGYILFILFQETVGSLGRMRRSEIITWRSVSNSMLLKTSLRLNSSLTTTTVETSRYT